MVEYDPWWQTDRLGRRHEVLAAGCQLFSPRSSQDERFNSQPRSKAVRASCAFVHGLPYRYRLGLDRESVLARP